jgi:hypothetical protein
MKSLRDYITEAEIWVDTPAQGDVLAINIREECLIETHIVDVRTDGVVVHADEKMMSLLESYGYAAEEIRRYGPVGTGSGTGYTGVAETCGSESNYEPEDAFQRVMELAGLGTPNAAHNDPLAAKAADLAPVGTEQDPTTATTVDEGVMSEVDQDLQDIADSQDFDMLYAAFDGEMGGATKTWLDNMFARIAQHRRLHPDDQQEEILEIMMDEIVADYGTNISEAEYQGRKVQLGKPTRGDVKKFKVYVKDPSTGNIKKVNFGDPNMKIKKSNPKRRKSFRARHNCDNPGPRTKARYWSCRAW